MTQPAIEFSKIIESLTVRLPQGALRELVVSALPIFGPEGELQQVVSILLDITREVAVITELRIFELFFELSADLFVVATPDFRVLKVNGAVQLTLGWPGEAYLGRGLVDLLHPDDLALAFADPRQAPREYTARMRTADGSYRSIGWRVARRSTPQLGETLFLRGTDVTQRLLEQRQISRSRELLGEAFEFAELAVIERDLTEGTAHLTSRLKELLQLEAETATSLDEARRWSST